MIDDFHPWGSLKCRRRGVPLSGEGGTSKGDMLLTPTTPFSQRAEPSLLWSGTFPKPRIRRGTTRISRVGCDKAKRVCASRVPLPPGVTARRTGGEKVVRATPMFWPLVRHGGGQRGTGVGTPFVSPFWVALTTVIPGGKAIRPTGKSAPLTAKLGSGRRQITPRR